MQDWVRWVVRETARDKQAIAVEGRSLEEGRYCFSGVERGAGKQPGSVESGKSGESWEMKQQLLLQRRFVRER